MKFIAEIKNGGFNKTASGDIVYKVILITNNPEILALGTIGPEQLVKVTIEAPDDTI